MRRWMPLLGVVLVTGCGASRSQVLREQYRASEAERARYLTGEEAKAFRSTEAVRGARWGMTPEELLAARGEPREREGNRWVYAEDFDGAVVSSSYLFVRGQLVAINTAWRREELTRERLEAALRAKYGAPVSRADVQAQLHKLLEDAIREDGLGTGAGWPGSSRAELQRELVDARARPLFQILWTAPETLVELVSPDGQRSLVTWRSRQLSGLFLEHERGGPGPEPLKEKM